MKGAGVADQLVQEVDNVTEFGTVVPLLLPAVKHELVKRSWAAHGSWKPVALFNGQYNLQKYSLYDYQPLNDARAVEHWQLETRDDKLSMAQPPSLYALLGLHSGNRDWQGCDQRRQEILCRHMKHSRNSILGSLFILCKQLSKQEGNKELTNTTIISIHFRGPQTHLVWPLHPTML